MQEISTYELSEYAEDAKNLASLSSTIWEAVTQGAGNAADYVGAMRILTDVLYRHAEALEGLLEAGER